MASRASRAGEPCLDEVVRRLLRGLPRARPAPAGTDARRGRIRAVMDGSTRNNARRDFYERIGTLSMAPLWESLHQLVPPAPAPKYVPAAWDYDQVRPFLMESGSLITAKEAVRRVLILEN